MKKTITKAPGTKIEINIFRRGDNVYIDIDKEQYALSLKEILELEDLDLRTSITTKKKTEVNKKNILDNANSAWNIFKSIFRYNAKKGDTLGFLIKRKHFSIIRDDGYGNIVLKNKEDKN